LKRPNEPILSSYQNGIDLAVVDTEVVCDLLEDQDRGRLPRAFRGFYAVVGQELGDDLFYDLLVVEGSVLTTGASYGKSHISPDYVSPVLSTTTSVRGSLGIEEPSLVN
jgi:hypothetical protein